MRVKKLLYLSNVCDLKMGQSPSSSSYNQDGIGIPFFQGNADFGDIHPEIRYWCNKPIKIAKANDILISVRAPIGAINIATEECCIGRGLAAITVKEDLGLNKYLYYVLKSRVNDLISNGKGSTFKAINKKDLEDILIPVPSVKEQNQIVLILDFIIKLILLRKRQINALNSLVKSHFVGMFGDPLTNPMGWEIIKLGNITDIGSSKRIFANEYVNDGIPFYRTKEIVELSQKKLIENQLYISQERYLKIVDEFGFPEREDLLISAVGTIGVIWVVDNDNPFYFKDGNLILVRKSDKAESIVLKMMLERLIKSFLGNLSVGSAYNALTIVKLKQLHLPLPPLTLQNRFAAFVQQVDKTKFVMKHNIKQLLTICLHYVEIKRKRWGK